MDHEVGAASQGHDASAPGEARRRFGRRRLVAAASGGVLAVAGAVAWWGAGGYAVPLAVERRLVALAPWEYAVVEQAARRLCAADGPAPSPDEVGTAAFVDRYVAQMHPTLRRDLRRLFAYLEHLAPLRAGLPRRFTSLDAAAQDRVLARMEAADEGLLRGGFAGLKSLVFMGYYGDPRTWAILGYDGPALERTP